MPFPFDVKKVLQAIGIVLEQHNEQTNAGSMDLIRLLKLLYIADRESLKDTGFSITRDDVYAMKHGPILSETYDGLRIKSMSRFADQWKDYIVREGAGVKLNKYPGKAKLSQYEVDTLKKVTMRFYSTDTWHLIEYTHSFPEWRKFNEPGTSTLIPLKSILQALRFTDAQIKTIEAESQSPGYTKQVVDGVLPQPRRTKNNNVIRELSEVVQDWPFPPNEDL